MSKRQKVFWLCVLWFFLCIPIGMLWAASPYWWAASLDDGDDSNRDTTPEAVAKLFPIHLASLPSPRLLQHIDQIDNDAPEEPAKQFNAREWGVREAGYRAMLCFFLWVGSGFYMKWFLGFIIRGRGSWDD